MRGGDAAAAGASLQPSGHSQQTHRVPERRITRRARRQARARRPEERTLLRSLGLELVGGMLACDDSMTRVLPLVVGMV